MPDFGPPTDGYKRFVFPDGKGVYDGHWRGCKRHGQGSFVFANGDSYEGESGDLRKASHVEVIAVAIISSPVVAVCQQVPRRAVALTCVVL